MDCLKMIKDDFLRGKGTLSKSLNQHQMEMVKDFMRVN